VLVDVFGDLQLTMNVPLVGSNLARPRPLVQERAVGVVIGTAIPNDRSGRDSANNGKKSSSRDHLDRRYV
jgi:hypothetical protein